MDLEASYLCGYLKIDDLTKDFPTMTTFFDGEIISERYPFLTRKWEADEEVDKKHWVWFYVKISGYPACMECCYFIARSCAIAILLKLLKYQYRYTKLSIVKSFLHLFSSPAHESSILMTAKSLST